MLPELKAQQLVHNEYYGGDEAERAQLKSRASALNKEVEGSAEQRKAAPKGWKQTQALIDGSHISRPPLPTPIHPSISIHTPIHPYPPIHPHASIFQPAYTNLAPPIHP